MNPFEPSQTLEAIHQSEINFEISTLWAAGFSWKLGDPFNGYHAEGNADTFYDAVRQLADAVCRHFPASAFSGGGSSTSAGTSGRTQNQCQACLEESGRTGPLRPSKQPIQEFDLLFGARRKCPKCGTEVFFKRDLKTGQA